MSEELAQVPLSAEELALRQRNVRKWVLLRGGLLGMIIAAWWIFFAPEAIVDAEYKNIMGVLVGLIATGSYLYNLRDVLFVKKQTGAD